MANGAATRWGNYLGVPKHLARVGEETLLERTVRLVGAAAPDAEVVISAHDERYRVKGARFYTPLRNDYEIDRFVLELLDEPCCFLYGDACYTPEAIDTICAAGGSSDLLFFGSSSRIFAVKVFAPEVAASLLRDLRAEIEEGSIPDCKGWQLYHRYLGMPLEGKAIGDDYVLIEDGTTDFNTPSEYEAYLGNR